MCVMGACRTEFCRVFYPSADVGGLQSCAMMGLQATSNKRKLEGGVGCMDFDMELGESPAKLGRLEGSWWAMDDSSYGGASSTSSSSSSSSAGSASPASSSSSASTVSAAASSSSSSPSSSSSSSPSYYDSMDVVSPQQQQQQSSSSSPSSSSSSCQLQQQQSSSTTPSTTSSIIIATSTSATTGGSGAPSPPSPSHQQHYYQRPNGLSYQQQQQQQQQQQRWLHQHSHHHHHHHHQQQSQQQQQQQHHPQQQQQQQQQQQSGYEPPTIHREQNGKSYIELGSSYRASAGQNERCCERSSWCRRGRACYRQRRLAVLNISMCKLARYRQFPDPSLHRSVLICNTLRYLEREMERDRSPPPALEPLLPAMPMTQLQPPEQGRLTPFPFGGSHDGADLDSGIGDSDDSRSINWGSVLSLSSQSPLDPLNNNELLDVDIGPDLDLDFMPSWKPAASSSSPLLLSSAAMSNAGSSPTHDELSSSSSTHESLMCAGT